MEELVYDGTKLSHYSLQAPRYQLKNYGLHIHQSL